MKRILYIISVLLLAACTEEIFSGENQDVSGSQISPMVRVSSIGLPQASTKSLVDASSVVALEANALRLDYESGMNWEDAYLTEATVSASSDSQRDYLRSMYLNPVQAYNEGKTTRLVSWYPRTCVLHKNDEGNAVVTKFSDYEDINGVDVYWGDEESADENGTVKLRFAGLDGSKDVMVSDIVSGTLDSPVGPMTYKHYMSAVKIYAYTSGSGQDVSMWGALKRVLVKNQPSEVLVALPSPDSSEDGSHGEAEFSTEMTDFPLIKTPVFGDSDPEPEVAPDSPALGKENDKENPIYLGYALIQPETDLKLDIYTDAGLFSVNVAKDIKDENGDVTGSYYFQSGHKYDVYINFDTSGTIAAIVMKSGEEHYYDLTAGAEFMEESDEGEGTGDGENRFEYKYANCYIVHPGIIRDNNEAYDGYAFNATVVGNGPLGLYDGFDRDDVTIDPVRAGLLWESSPGLITQVELLYGYVRFKADPNNEGNAVIAVYDSQRRVLWSWHIWITDQPLDVTHDLNGKDVVFLDRNLGATAPTVAAATATKDDEKILETYGLYYQWGRKDPSMGPPSSDYAPQSTATSDYYDYYGDVWKYAGVVTVPEPTVRDGVENPMYLVMPTDFSMLGYQYDWLHDSIDNLWGDYDHEATESTSTRQKTIYDPCPFGYMVPQDEISTLFSTLSSSSSPGIYGYTISGSFFPFAGYKGVDKGVSSLTGAWKYVGKKGDYMSSKIEPNGHRSRTYISYDSNWTEYGADNDDDDPDGNPSCAYNSHIYTDETANRRTAGSVRCIKRENALNATQKLILSGDKTYCFVGDVVTFDYSINAYGSNISDAYVDVNETRLDDVHVITNVSSTQSRFTYTVEDKSDGLARFRLVSTTAEGVTSRISHAVRVFDISELKIDGTACDDATCNYGRKYSLTFDLHGIFTNNAVYVNGVQAEVTGLQDGFCTVSCTVNNVYVPGHLNVQIRDAEGGLACGKTYEVLMNQIGNTFSQGTVVEKATDLEAGALYVIITKNDNGARRLYYDSENKKLILKQTNTLDKNAVFLFHRDDTKAGGVAANYNSVSAGAWMSLAADEATPGTEHDGFFNKNFSFVTESDAAYVTCANRWDSETDSFVDMYYGTSGEFLYYYSNYNYGLYWGANGNTSGAYKWQIYRVTPTN